VPVLIQVKAGGGAKSDISSERPVHFFGWKSSPRRQADFFSAELTWINSTGPPTT
jgi:hypothetical protein